MWSEFKGGMVHASCKIKYPQPEILESLLNIFYMFAIIIWVNDGDEPDTIGIKCKDREKRNWLYYLIFDGHD